MGAPVIPRFPTTHWSLVGRVAGHVGDTRAVALAELLRRYDGPIRHHLLTRWRLDPHDADDAVQEFLSEKVIQGRLLARADASRGRFRSFLLTALDNFVASQLRRETAALRGGAPGQVVSLDRVAEPADAAGGPPGRAFDVAWARAVLDEALQAMRRECQASNRLDLWILFEGRVLGPTLERKPPVDYVELTRRLDLPCERTAMNLTVTAKRMFVRRLRDVVGRYEPDEESIDAEIRTLRAIVAGRER